MQRSPRRAVASRARHCPAPQPSRTCRNRTACPSGRTAPSRTRSHAFSLAQVSARRTGPRCSTCPLPHQQPPVRPERRGPPYHKIRGRRHPFFDRLPVFGPKVIKCLVLGIGQPCGQKAYRVQVLSAKNRALSSATSTSRGAAARATDIVVSDDEDVGDDAGAGRIKEIVPSGAAQEEPQPPKRKERWVHVPQVRKPSGCKRKQAQPRAAGYGHSPSLPSLSPRRTTSSRSSSRPR